MTDYQDTLQGLADRVSALEAAAGPTYSPLNGMVVAADGSITYDFDGHISAKGVDIDANDLNVPGGLDDQHAVTWHRPDDQSIVARVVAYCDDISDPTDGIVVLQARDRAGKIGAQLDLEAGRSDLIEVKAGDHTLTILDGLGSSSFPRLVGLGRVELDGPYVANVAAGLIAGGSTSVTFTVADYTGATIVPVLSIGAQPADLGRLTYAWHALSPNQVQVGVHNASGATTTATSQIFLALLRFF